MNDEYKRFAVIDSYSENEYLLLISEDGININSLKDEKGRIVYFNSLRSAKLQATKRNLITVEFDEFLEKLNVQNNEPDFIDMEIYKALFPSMFVKYSILEMWDGAFCLAKNENLCGGYYDNKDNSLKYLTKNRNMLPFLQGSHFNMSQSDLVNLTNYTEEDLAEWAKLLETELGSLEKIYEPTFLGQVFINYNALVSLSKTSISAASYAKVLDFKTKDYSYINLSELASERGLWNFTPTEINRIMNNKIPVVKVLFDIGEYLFMVPPECIELFIPNRNLTKLEGYKTSEEGLLAEPIAENEKPSHEANDVANFSSPDIKIRKFLDRLIKDAADLVAYGKSHETECVERYEKYYNQLLLYKNGYEKEGQLDLSSFPKIEDYLPGIELNWREDKHSKLSKEIERLLTKNMEV